MPRHITPAMRERADFVGAYIKAHHTGGRVPPSLMREAHAAFSAGRPSGTMTATPRRNPWDGEDYVEEVETATVGTVIGLGVFTLIIAGVCAAVNRARSTLNGSNG